MADMPEILSYTYLDKRAYYFIFMQLSQQTCLKSYFIKSSVNKVCGVGQETYPSEKEDLETMKWYLHDIEVNKLTDINTSTTKDTLITKNDIYIRRLIE